MPGVRSFSCEKLRPLIICRGPLRKEAMDIFDEMGIHHYGILLSEKDSIAYDTALAPELRRLPDPARVHRVPDYSGADEEERAGRIREIIAIAKEGAYDSIFAGYGFMAEDYALVSAIEKAGLTFIGPASRVVHDAGFKDEAKRTAQAVGVSVVPGVDNTAALTLLAKYPDAAALKRLVQRRKLAVSAVSPQGDALALEELAERVLAAARAKGIDLFSVEELGLEAQRQAGRLLGENPQCRIRLKAVGGGGGKGQRVLEALDAAPGSPGYRQQLRTAVAAVPARVREVLTEAGAMGPGAVKNILLELNIEHSRHQEIQLVGNGNWCVALGGRDCSVQMHEQKLLELSLTDEMLAAEIERERTAGRRAAAAALKRERKRLARMEEEALAFGRATGLDSVSTFECIVTAQGHFFMEMNTRIQVEHRVTELCYGLHFCNPEASEETFTVTSLVEMMVLLAVHGERLPPPQRVCREAAAAEARLNATDDSLAPHAGGLIEYWSEPSAGELRDDQGICLRNPDTGAFMRYRLAGAYDSNIALLLSTGTSRADSLESLARILRKMVLRGEDLATNLDFHRGLLDWLLSQEPHARLPTNFVPCYLAAAGLLQQQAQRLDAEHAWAQMAAARCRTKEMQSAWEEILAAKRLLILRPVLRLLERPHLLAGWLSRSRHCFRRRKNSMELLCNPVQLIADAYVFLGMDRALGGAASEQIWSHDQEVLEQGLDFYSELRTRLKIEEFPSLQRRLARTEVPAGFSASLWQRSRAAHLGFQCGTELFALLPLLAERTGFYGLQARSDLEVEIPARFTDTAFQEEMRRVLAPPPVMQGDEIVAASGGMFYLREAPDLPPLVAPGDHFDAGQSLYIVEVMKMFNKVSVPFAGTIEEILVEEGGTAIRKGQPLFKVRPDIQDSAAAPHGQDVKCRQFTEHCLQELGII